MVTLTDPAFEGIVRSHEYFDPGAGRFDYELFGSTVATAVRMLDNVLDATAWPLPQQAAEAAAKRRVGLGYTGLGDVLIMLGLRYDSQQARDFAADLTLRMRDAAYIASIELAKEKAPFPAFDAEKYLASGMAQRLPESIREQIREHGIRNSHLLSIAPTGTISLAFGDNCSNGLEPAFSWFYKRLKREADGSRSQYQVEDHAYRAYREAGGDVDKLPEAFVSALEINANDHMLMQAAIQPYICASISKTVNVPEDYPFAQFKELYVDAWKHGLKGITTNSTYDAWTPARAYSHYHGGVRILSETASAKLASPITVGCRKCLTQSLN